jgi:hypothetical protein
MRLSKVRALVGLVGCAAILMAAKCGGKGGYLTEPVPGVGLEVPLAQVDGKAVPLVIVSNATDQTSVVGGKATLGEAIASGQYSITLQHSTGASVMRSTVSGTVVFDWESGPGVAAMVDLGAGLGTHTFRFQQ